jgi:hypothetical protein
MSLPPELTTPRDERHGSKIGDLVRRLSSRSEGEIVATVFAMDRVLGSVGADFHDLAEHIEAPNGKSIPEEKLQQVWDAAWAQCVQTMENRQHGVDDFIGTDDLAGGRAVPPAQQASAQSAGA